MLYEVITLRPSWRRHVALANRVHAANDARRHLLPRIVRGDDDVLHGRPSEPAEFGERNRRDPRNGRCNSEKVRRRARPQAEQSDAILAKAPPQGNRPAGAVVQYAPEHSYNFV